MANIHDLIRDRAHGSALHAHLDGAVRDRGYSMVDGDRVLTGVEASDLWDRFAARAGIDVEAERKRGFELPLWQFVDDAARAWRRARR